MTTVILYSRISDDRDGTRAGVERQHEDLVNLAAGQGWDVVGDFTDNDITAYTDKNRPGWDAALELLETGDIDVLAVWASDRLTRRPRELEDLVDLLERTGVKISTVTSGEYDLATPEGRAVARIVGAIARQESERKAVRIKAQYKQDIDRGHTRILGSRPFGYTSDQMSVVEGEAKWLREGYKLVADGGSINAVWRLWNSNNVVTTKGGTWAKTSVRRVLTDPRYTALRRYKGEVVGDAPWDAIIDRGQFEKVQAIIGSRSNADRHPPRKYLLTGGVARCGLCSEQLIARPTGSGKRAYICPPVASNPELAGCGHVKILADWLEGHVKEQVMSVFDPALVTQAVVELAGEIDATEVAAEIGRLEQALDEVSKDYYSERLLTRSQFDTSHRALTAKLKAARGSLVPPEASLVVDGDLGEWWESAEVADRRDLVKLVVERVDVAAGVRGRNKFDPERIKIVWSR